MQRGLLFWIIWVICVLIWAGVNFGGMGAGFGAARLAGGGVIEFVLFGLLGWAVFGPVVRA
jgi:hypothetical protein